MANFKDKTVANGVTTGTALDAAAMKQIQQSNGLRVFKGTLGTGTTANAFGSFLNKDSFMNAGELVVDTSGQIFRIKDFRNSSGTAVAADATNIAYVQVENTESLPKIGGAGKGISSTTVAYRQGSSGTSAPTGTWSSTVPTVTAGYFLWTRITMTYTDGTTTTAYAVAKHGATGPQGATGATGPQGPAGGGGGGGGGSLYQHDIIFPAILQEINSTDGWGLLKTSFSVLSASSAQITTLAAIHNMLGARNYTSRSEGKLQLTVCDTTTIMEARGFLNYNLDRIHIQMFFPVFNSFQTQEVVGLDGPIVDTVTQII